MRNILGYMRRCDETHHLIEEGDNIAVGVSGGKDSMVLAKALSSYRLFSKKKFNIHAITLDLGFEEFDSDTISKFMAENNIDFTLVPTEIGKIVFDIRKEKNPCSLCSKMKRGALHDAALNLGCKKVALGHHFDDAIQTFFLSLFYEGRFNTMPPKKYLDRKNITLIRPMIYSPEIDVINAGIKANIPSVKSGCKADGTTKRKEIELFIDALSDRYPDIKKRLFNALTTKDNRNLW